MSRTPAGELARLKAAFPDWSIRRVHPGKGTGFTAHRRAEGRGSRSLYIHTLAELERQLRLADKGGQRG